MPLNYRTIAGPLIEPITLAQAKAQCRVDTGFTNDDTLFSIYIASARQNAERVTRRAFFNQTWVRTLDNFPLAASFDYSPSPADRWNWPVYGGMWNRLVIDLPGGPVQRIISITYWDVSGSTVTLDPSLYAADLSSVPCRVTPANGLVWPWQGTYLPGSVQITYEVASFVSAVAETFTVPASPGPYTYTLLQTPQTAVESVTALILGVATPISGWTVSNGILTLPSAQAGAQLTANYSVPNSLTPTAGLLVPADVANAMLLLIEHFYRNPGAASDLRLEELPFGIESLLRGHVVEWTDYRPC